MKSTTRSTERARWVTQSRALTPLCREPLWLSICRAEGRPYCAVGVSRRAGYSVVYDLAPARLFLPWEGRRTLLAALAALPDGPAGASVGDVSGHCRNFRTQAQAEAFVELVLDVAERVGVPDQGPRAQAIARGRKLLEAMEWRG